MSDPSRTATHIVSARAIERAAVPELRRILALFGKAFDDDAAYRGNQPSDQYLHDLLASPGFIAIAGYVNGALAGGLAGYVLAKFEQARSEFYIYDLAVDESHRRRGVATAMIEELKAIARHRKIYVIYVQADRVDEPAIALYTKMGTREEVLHFDIDPSDRPQQR